MGAERLNSTLTGHSLHAGTSAGCDSRRVFGRNPVSTNELATTTGDGQPAAGILGIVLDRQSGRLPFRESVFQPADPITALAEQRDRLK